MGVSWSSRSLFQPRIKYGSQRMKWANGHYNQRWAGKTVRPAGGVRRAEQTQCVCVLSTQPCPARWDLMDCSPPGSSVHGIFQAGKRSLVGYNPFPTPGNLPNQGLNSCLLSLLHWQVDSLPLHHLCEERLIKWRGYQTSDMIHNLKTWILHPTFFEPR